jgi:methyl-accepting chemotaxis protein
MIDQLTKLSVRARIIALILVSLGGMLLISTFSLLHIKALMMEGREEKVRSLVEVGIGIVDHYYQLSQQGKISEVDAKKQAIDELRTLRYDDVGYFFGFEPNGDFFLSPNKPEMEGKNYINQKDANGTMVTQVLLSAAQHGGFSRYEFAKIGQQTPEPKLSYSRIFTPWNWVLATGIFIDDVDHDFRIEAIRLGGIAVVLLAVLLIIGWMTIRSVMTTLGGEPAYTVEIAGELAAGNFAANIKLHSGDHFSLLRALTKVKESLSTTVINIQSVSASIASSSSQIAIGNMDLSARTEEQAASLEQTAASMTELTETVRQNAENARQANALAMSATDTANTGNESVQAMVATIGQISSSSSKISEITGVIEGIAFQTNILALNAAVEAARAGEQGRGFAVVASEVRSLAQRSASAAKEIKALISASVATIQEGAKQATEVSGTMGQVKQAIRQVSDIVGEIAAASEEQSRGIEQVNQAVVQMDEVTQQNAALVEEAAAAAQSLEEQAIRLKEVVSVFRVDSTGQSLSDKAPPQGKLGQPTARVPAKIDALPAKPRPEPIVAGGKLAGEAVDRTKTEWETF